MKMKHLKKLLEKQKLKIVTKVVNYRVVSSVGRASALQAECRQFEPVTTHQVYSLIAQSVERRTVNPQVRGSSPLRGATQKLF